MTDILEDEYLSKVKESMLGQPSKNQEFIESALEYINYSSMNNDDMFFYDYMAFIRFISDPQYIAFTTPDKEIYLNMPGRVGKDEDVWEFIYDHECLHQLWDTFKVGDQIEKKYGECDHTMLNIASDCVINDYLKRARKKKPFENGIFPETLEERFGIEYNYKKDTQFTLYEKMWAKKDEIRKDPMFKQQQQEDAENEKAGKQNSGVNGGQKNGQSGQGSQSSQGDQEGSPSGNAASDAAKATNEAADAAENGDAKAAADAAKRAADAAKEAEDKAKGGDASPLDKKAAKAARDAAKAAKKAADAAKKGDKDKIKEAVEEAREAAKKAQEAADKANEAANKQNGPQGNGKGNGPGNGKKAGRGHKDITSSTKSTRELADEVIEKYKRKISGAFGEFIKKCQSSQKLEKESLIAKVDKGAAHWNKEVHKLINTYIQQRIWRKKRELEETYSRVKRGSGFVKYGEPIFPGTKIKEQKLNITMAFYTDRSGSMSNCIKNVFNATFDIAEDMIEKYSKDNIVGDIKGKYYAFDDYVDKVQFRKIPNVGDGTLSAHELFQYIYDNDRDNMINVVLTDGGFSGIERGIIDKLMNAMDGIFIVIVDAPCPEIEKIAMESNGKMKYIEAGANFILG